MKLIEKLRMKLSRSSAPTEETVVADVLAELERRRAERMPFELQWRLNAAFMGGAQRCEINPYSNRIEENAPAYDYEERGVFNRIAPLMDTRLANLKTVSFTMAVHPATEDGDDLQKAQICSDLLRYAYTAGDFEHKKNTLLQWAELTGSAFLLSSWDKDGGVPLCLSEDGREVKSGDLRYTLLSPYEVFPENLYRQSMEDQGSVIIEQIMSAKEIEALYGVECKGREMLSAVLQSPSGSTLSAAMSGSVSMRDSERVITYMEAPTSSNPTGTLVQIAAGKLVHFGPLPLGVMPVTAFRAKENAGQFFGKSVIEDLIPLQRAYNGCKNKIHDYISTLAANSLLIEEGSVDVELMEANGTAPGFPVVYKRGYTPPSPMHHETMPGEVYAECEQLCRDMEYVAGVSQLMVVGTSAAGITSGKAINSLREIDSTRMALCAENMRAGALATAKLWLRLYKEYCPGAMTLAVSGENRKGAVITWCSQDINTYDVYFELQNELRVSAEQRKAAFFEAYDRGLFADENGMVPAGIKAKAIALLQGAEAVTEPGESALQHSRAVRENNLFSVMGTVPELGALDDHAVHIEEHRRFALQAAFENILRRDKASGEAFLAHIAEHEEAGND